MVKPAVANGHTRDRLESHAVEVKTLTNNKIFKEAHVISVNAVTRENSRVTAYG